MAMDPSVRIDLAAEFTGKKAFGQADTATQKLTKSAKNLARTFGVAFGTAAVIGFAKKSIKASIEAQAQQDRLASLLRVTVGATDAQVAALNEQANALERVGVVSAGNITQTQSQLATFNLQFSTIKKLTPAILDYVTAEKGATASTEQFKSMTNGLAQALNGNFASLTKTGFVLDENTKSIIKNGTESERVEAIVAVLDSTYKDFNKNLRDTPVGQMAVLANAAQEASTVIGTSLLGALQSVTNSTDIEQLAEKIVQFSKTAGRAIEQLGITIHENLRTLKSLAITFAAIWTSTAIMAGIQGILKIILSLTKAYKILRATALGAAIAEAAVLNPLGAIAWGATLVATITAATIQINKLSDAFSDADGQAKKLGDTIGNYQMSTGSMLDLGAINRSVDALYVRKALAAKLKADKAAAAAKLKADKKASANLLKLKKAESVFDMQKIQIAAALKGKISEEEKTRLLLMQAIADEDATKAEKLQKKLEQIQAQNAEIAASLLAIGEATDPFAAWVTSLDAAALILGKMPALLDATGSLTGRGKVTLPTGIYTPDMTASEIADTATAAADMAVAAAEAAVASVLASDPIVAAIVEAANAATGMTDVITNAPIVTGSSSMFNPYGTTPGSSSGYGTQAPTIIVNNNGSVIMQDELIDVVSDAVLASQRFGYGRTPAGAIT
jgi:hypothetical protein